MRSVLIALFAFVALVAAQGIAKPFTHHAFLENIQDGAASTAFGAAVISSDGKGTLHYTIVNNVLDTKFAHIHGPAQVNVTAGVLVTIPGFENMPNGLPVATGSVSIPAANYDDLNQGRLYLNIHSNTYPNGEIRGQILANNQQLTLLTGSQDGVTTNATGIAFTSYNPSNKNFTVVLAHNVQQAILIHVHGPALAGASAAPIITIAGNAAAATAASTTYTTTLTSDQEGWLYSGQLYYNVHSTPNPNGEVRGQINPIVNLLASMDGNQDSVSTSEQGVGMAGLYSGNLWTAIVHNVAAPTAAHIHKAAVGSSGNVVFPYSVVNQTDIISQVFPSVTSAQASDLTGGNNYFNIHTAANPNGEIRGQIYPKSNDNGKPGTSTTGSGSMVVASVALTFAAVVALMA